MKKISFTVVLLCIVVHLFAQSKLKYVAFTTDVPIQNITIINNSTLDAITLTYPDTIFALNVLENTGIESISKQTFLTPKTNSIVTIAVGTAGVQHFQLLDLTGTLVCENEFDLPQGKYDFKITVARAGIYVLKVENADQKAAIKVNLENSQNAQILYSGNSIEYSSLKSSSDILSYTQGSVLTVMCVTEKGMHSLKKNIQVNPIDDTTVISLNFLPSFGSLLVTNMTDTTANIQYDIDNNVDLETEIERGFCINGIFSKIDDQQGNTFSLNLSNLILGEKYIVQPYVKNNEFTKYGDDFTFTPSLRASVITSAIVDISYTNAVVGGNVTSSNGAEVMECGVCWCTLPQPTISDSKQAADTNSGAYSVSIAGLEDNTTYYVRAYATNAKGISYGEIMSFTTIKITEPTVITSSVTNVSYISAVVGGNMTSSNGAEVTECGVCWSTLPQPTISDSKQVADTNSGAYSVSIAGLTENTTYYVRSYAINSIGISYGEDQVFTTLEVQAPTVTTSTATNISYTSAVVGGNVTSSNGADVTERGVCWSRYRNPTISDKRVKAAKSVLGTYSVSIVGLTADATYYVRAYAKNSIGISYGEEQEFKTLEAQVPTVTTSSAKSITYTSSVVGGNVTSANGAEVTECGVCWSTLPQPTISDSKQVADTNSGVYSVSITGLTANTTYYVRAYAKNSVGIAYGKVVSLKTSNYVDLGLSVMWATFNIGADSIEEYGNYYAWGETTTKTDYTWTTYKYCEGTATTLTKYNNGNYNSGVVDNIFKLNISDDIVYQTYGGKWRMPTKAEFDELISKCTWEWTTIHGVKGYKVSATNGNYIFLPAAGTNNKENVGSEGFYWSSTVFATNCSAAYGLNFTSNSKSSAFKTRFNGLPIRPVITK